MADRRQYPQFVAHTLHAPEETFRRSAKFVLFTVLQIVLVLSYLPMAVPGSAPSIALLAGLVGMVVQLLLVFVAVA